MTLRLVQITDTHLFEREETAHPIGCVTSRSLRRVLDHVAARSSRPDLLLLTGDLSDDGSPESYRRLRRWVEELGVPYLWIPGNHDDSATIEVELPAHSRNVVREGWRLVLVSSKRATPDHDGEVSADELERLAETLAAASEPTLVAIHHPPLAVGSRWLDEQYPLRNADSVRDIVLRQAQVRVVLFGHVHQEFDATVGGVRFLGAPATCDQFVPGIPQFARDDVAPGYRVVELHSDGALDTEVIRVKTL